MICVIFILKGTWIVNGNELFDSFTQKTVIHLSPIDYTKPHKKLQGKKVDEFYKKIKNYMNGLLIRTTYKPGITSFSDNAIAIITDSDNHKDLSQIHFYIQKELGLTILYIPNVGKYILFNDAYEEILKEVNSIY